MPLHDWLGLERFTHYPLHPIHALWMSLCVKHICVSDSVSCHMYWNHLLFYISVVTCVSPHIFSLMYLIAPRNHSFAGSFVNLKASKILSMSFLYIFLMYTRSTWWHVAEVYIWLSILSSLHNLHSNSLLSHCNSVFLWLDSQRVWPNHTFVYSYALLFSLNISNECLLAAWQDACYIYSILRAVGDPAYLSAYLFY